MLFKKFIFIFLFNGLQIFSFLTLLAFINKPSFKIWDLFPILGSILILYGWNSCRQTIIQKFLQQRPFISLGKMSYSLYLSHTFFILVIDPQFAAKTYGLFPALIFTVVICLLGAYSIHRLFESPCQIVLTRFFRRVQRQIS